MTVVIVAAAAVALLLLIAILALGRSRSDEEVDRFRHVSELTSAWSRQANVAAAKGQPIDLRDAPKLSGKKAKQAEKLNEAERVPRAESAENRG